MSVGEKCSGCGQAIEVRSLGLRVTAKATDPVIEVVDGNEQDILRLGSVDAGRPKQVNQDPFDNSTSHFDKFNRKRGNLRKEESRRLRS